ncbi:MAG: putative ABC transport system ATP-binding protein [Polaribacter sp.]|jgi:putative ABC transport system ATP-binding protein
MLKVEKLNKIVATGESSLQILKDISFFLSKGKSLAIVGESGSGKTTLLGLLAGLDKPTSGKVSIDGNSIFEMSEDERALVRKNAVGFVFQSFQLIDGLTALENVMMPLELRGDKKAKEKALSQLEQVGLSERVNHFPNQLSGGEQQRVAVARAFVCEPQVLFADEPTGNLDTNTGQKVVDLMFSLNQKKNTTMVLVTHDIKLASRCDYKISLSAGELIESDLPQ